MPSRRGLAAIAALMLASLAQAGAVGTVAPDFTRPDLEGRPFRLASLRGRVVLLNFWASWCAPCLAEMPQFSAWQRQYGDRGLQIVGVAMDDEPAKVRQFMARHPAGYPIVMGDAKLGEVFGGVLGLPLTYVIGRDGVIAVKHPGGDNLNQLLGQVRRLLDSAGPAMVSSGR